MLRGHGACGRHDRPPIRKTRASSMSVHHSVHHCELHVSIISMSEPEGLHMHIIDSWQRLVENLSSPAFRVFPRSAGNNGSLRH